MRFLSQKSITKACLWFAALSGAYLYAFPGPILFYISISLAHIALGVVAVLAAPFLIHKLRGLSRLGKAAVALLVLGAIDGVVVMVVGGTRPHLDFVYLHSILSFAGVLLLAAHWMCSRRWLSPAGPKLTAQCAALFLVGILVTLGAHYLRVQRWDTSTPIRNPE